MSKQDEKGIRQFVVAPDDDGIRLDRWFKRHLPDASFNIVSRWARTGQLGAARRFSDGLRAAVRGWHPASTCTRGGGGGDDTR
jgi:hypothetical protein